MGFVGFGGKYIGTRREYYSAGPCLLRVVGFRDFLASVFFWVVVFVDGYRLKIMYTCMNLRMYVRMFLYQPGLAATTGFRVEDFWLRVY